MLAGAAGCGRAQAWACFGAPCHVTLPLSPPQLTCHLCTCPPVSPSLPAAATEFSEMFVGVGASRVRDMFKQARENVSNLVLIARVLV